MTRFCPSCGEKMPDSARFCKSCGAGLDGYAQPKRPEMPQPERKSFPILIFIGYVVAILSPILGLIAGIFMLTVKNTEGTKKHGLLIILLSIAVFVFKMIFFR